MIIILDRGNSTKKIFTNDNSNYKSDVKISNTRDQSKESSLKFVAERSNFEDRSLSKHIKREQVVSLENHRERSNSRQ